MGESLSDLAHEMCHHEQYHFCKSGRRIYCNEEWADMMKAIGLIPAKTRESVRKPRREVSHYVVPGGPFALACAELVKSGFAVRYVELWSDEQAPITKYICPACGLGAWGKPAINLVCGSCDERMEGEETNREGESGS